MKHTRNFWMAADYMKYRYAASWNKVWCLRMLDTKTDTMARNCNFVNCQFSKSIQAHFLTKHHFKKQEILNQNIQIFLYIIILITTTITTLLVLVCSKIISVNKGTKFSKHFLKPYILCIVENIISTSIEYSLPAVQNK